ncbi:MAG TPA: BTAD domain-containing putative transcriptional regulator [Amycolatopsis sp.]|uniref:AfsR/SARP family transcriptional regulator n=1 Tax=Amycolatopsis sp. TaxID=37632 RepID=UPI002B464C57|nr:BTAD domain-containing putative transcriptional regulator [Amycolatopsis sp.]HKS45087.1 BTAD domain-containing putative transcriptional regulator [Amycolatopsis sp.]
MGDGLRIRLLGPVQLLDAGRPVPVGGPAVRGLLALLALEPNRIVPLDDLIDALWSANPPATARTIVHGNVSHLRRVLGALGSPEQARIETAAPGYRLAIDPDRIDVHRAHVLFDRAAGLPLPERAELLALAYALFEGPELSGVPDSVSAPELTDLRLAVHGARVDADLALGRHAELIAELTAMVRENPRAERTVGQLMRALYYSGRRADALDIYRRVARFSSAKFGIDPGPELRALQERILNDSLPATEPARPPAVDVTRVIPRQLPRESGTLAGREAELDWLDGLAEGAVAVITGIAGVGKSALAVSWAHRAAKRFPGGVLFAALRGFDPHHPPAEPGDVLTQFLLGLGVPLADLPERHAERVALYRSLIAGRWMLVVLDDARSAEQVRPLLPPGSRSMALVTSRARLDGLIVSNAARVRRLDPLSRPDSVRLIAGLAGHRTAGHRERLAELCGDLPLALRIARTRLASGPQWSAERFLAELTEERTRLSALDVDDAGVRAALEVSFRVLPPGVAETFRALGALGISTVGPHLVAAIERTDLAEARRRLHVLSAHHLLTESGPDVFTQHDLVRLYQRELATPVDCSRVPAQAVRYYLTAADRARRGLPPVVDGLDFRAAEFETPEPAGFDDALAFFAAEWPNLLATLTAAQAAGRHEDVWRLARVVHTYRVVRPLWDEWARLLSLGMASAEAAGSGEGRYWMLVSRCTFARTFEVTGACLADAEAALTIARSLGERRLVVSAEIHLGCALTLRGRYDEAIDRLRAAAEETARTGDDDLHGQALNHCAEAEKRAGKYVEAIEHQTASLAIDRRFGDDGYVAVSLNNLAELHLGLGDLEAARRCARSAIELTEQRGFLLQEAVSRRILGRILRASGAVEDARVQLALALELYKRVSPRHAPATADGSAALELERG